MENTEKGINLYDVKPTKQYINDFADNLINVVVEGGVAVEKQVVLLRAIQESIGKALDELKPHLMDELAKYGKGEQCRAMGVGFEVREVGVKYDYGNCNDPILNKALEAKKEIDAQVKQRQEFLRKLTGMAFIVDEETGELMEVYPPVKLSTTGYVINFPND